MTTIELDDDELRVLQRRIGPIVAMRRRQRAYVEKALAENCKGWDWLDMIMLPEELLGPGQTVNGRYNHPFLADEAREWLANMDRAETFAKKLQIA